MVVKRKSHKRASARNWAEEPLEPSISLCLITRDEERFIERCIKSVSGVCDQIVVVDTGSIDRTVELAKSCGAEVYTFEWNDSFSDARNASLEKATGDWIMVLDADGELDPSSKGVVREVVQQNSFPTAVRGSAISSCGDGSELLQSGFTILFPNDPRMRYGGDIHEQILVSGQPPCGIDAPIVMLHYGYLDDVKQAKNKDERNGRLLQRALARHPDDFAIRWSVAEYFANFPERSEAGNEYQACYAALLDGTWCPPNVEGWAAAVCGGLAGLKFRQGDVTQAECFARQGLEHQPFSTEGLFWLAHALAACSRWSDAASCFEQLLSGTEAEYAKEVRVYRAMRTWKAHDGFADCSFNLGAYEDALRAARASAALNPKSPISWLVGSASASMLGKSEIAARWLDMAIEVGSPMEPTWFAYKRLRHAATDFDPVEGITDVRPTTGPARLLIQQMRQDVNSARRDLVEIEKMERPTGVEVRHRLDGILTVWPNLARAQALRRLLAS